MLSWWMFHKSNIILVFNWQFLIFIDQYLVLVFFTIDLTRQPSNCILQFFTSSAFLFILSPHFPQLDLQYIQLSTYIYKLIIFAWKLLLQLDVSGRSLFRLLLKNNNFLTVLGLTIVHLSPHNIQLNFEPPVFPLVLLYNFLQISNGSSTSHPGLPHLLVQNINLLHQLPLLLLFDPDLITQIMKSIIILHHLLPISNHNLLLLLIMHLQISILLQ